MGNVIEMHPLICTSNKNLELSMLIERTHKHTHTYIIWTLNTGDMHTNRTEPNRTAQELHKYIAYFIMWMCEWKQKEARNSKTMWRGSSFDGTIFGWFTSCCSSVCMDINSPRTYTHTQIYVYFGRPQYRSFITSFNYPPIRPTWALKTNLIK